MARNSEAKSIALPSCCLTKSRNFVNCSSLSPKSAAMFGSVNAASTPTMSGFPSLRPVLGAAIEMAHDRSKLPNSLEFRRNLSDRRLVFRIVFVAAMDR